MSVGICRVLVYYKTEDTRTKSKYINFIRFLQEKQFRVGQAHVILIPGTFFLTPKKERCKNQDLILDASQNSFILDDPQVFVPFVKIVQVL